MKQVTAEEFLKLFNKEVYNQIAESLANFQSDNVVCFENHDFSSSRFGDRSALGVGKNNTYKNIKECEGRWLNDLPSQRQYPTCYADAKEVISLIRSF